MEAFASMYQVRLLPHATCRSRALVVRLRVRLALAACQDNVLVVLVVLRCDGRGAVCVCQKYDHEVYWFECVHLIFKVYFAGFALIFANLTVQYQLTVCLVSLIAYSTVSAQLQAYKHVADDFLWNACLSCLFVSLYVDRDGCHRHRRVLQSVCRRSSSRASPHASSPRDPTRRRRLCFRGFVGAGTSGSCATTTTR